MATLSKTTKPTKAATITRSWHVIDAKDQVMGRLSSRIAGLLQGKGKAYYTPNMDCGDHVVVINAAHIVLTGKKAFQKEYDRYSGYPGGRKTVVAGELIKQAPDKALRHALKGMLPKNKLRDPRLARLHVFAGAEHTFTDKFNS